MINDARGWRMHSYGDVLDVGDQNADGRGDLATSSYVYFTDPARETGVELNPRRAAAFVFGFPSGWSNVAAPIRRPQRRRQARARGDSRAPHAPQRDRMARRERHLRPRRLRLCRPRPRSACPTCRSSASTGSCTCRSTSSPAPGCAVPRRSACGPTPADRHPERPGASPSRASTPAGRRPPARALALERAPRPRALGGAPLSPATGLSRALRRRHGPRAEAPPGPWRSFVFQPGATAQRAVRKRRDRRDGDPHAARHRAPHDRLIGTAGPDRLLGLAGERSARRPRRRRRARRRRGRDRLLGGKGDDVLSGRSGVGPSSPAARAATTSTARRATTSIQRSSDGARDVVRCGKGRDRVTADRKDRLEECERVSRR